MTATTVDLANVDDYLGPAETRFFGSGYRRASYDYSPITIAHNQATGDVTVAYPADWSRKKEHVDLRPHLSTVDTMVVGAQYAIALVAAEHGLDAQDRDRCWVSAMALRAGTRPEEELDHIPVEARIRRTVPGHQPGSLSSVVEVSVGQMRIRCTISHPPRAGLAFTGPATPRLEDILGPTSGRYWGDGFRSRSQLITDVTADIAAGHATATLHATQVQGHDDSASGNDAGVDLVDLFVSALQVAQVLMYEMDGIRREDSATLWMQQTTLTREARTTPDSGPTALTVNITESQILKIADARWRNITFTATCANIAQRSTFAHRID